MQNIQMSVATRWRGLLLAVSATATTTGARAFARDARDAVVRG